MDGLNATSTPVGMLECATLQAWSQQNKADQPARIACTLCLPYDTNLNGFFGLLSKASSKALGNRRTAIFSHSQSPVDAAKEGQDGSTVPHLLSGRHQEAKQRKACICILTETCLQNAGVGKQVCWHQWQHGCHGWRQG